PEHARVYREAGWDKARVKAELHACLQIPTDELVRGAAGIAEGVAAAMAGTGTTLPKFRPDGLWLVHAGGRAGLFSAIIGGWVGGKTGSEMVTKEVTL